MHSVLNKPIRTRFAPSPTGYLHLGGARTALYSWAYAKHYARINNNLAHGVFVLRIEDTDIERSTPEAVKAILDGMNWLGLYADEGPFYQMQHIARYQAVIKQMLSEGSAYFCYSTPAELDTMREMAKIRGDKPRYDGTWRPELGKTLPVIPKGILPVVRFKHPQEGVVIWDDLVKGTIKIDNRELDDFVIARAVSPESAFKGDLIGIPTYNFCVVIDDWDMNITHIIRGDDHINNTPRQINLFNALNAPIPYYAHLPMILGNDGEKLSKRHGSVNLMQYDALGYLPQAMLNYLARLGWSHGDTEIFSSNELIDWFDGTHLNKSAAQWDIKKLNWVNAHYIKYAPLEQIMAWLLKHCQLKPTEQIKLAVLMMRDRSETLIELANWIKLFTIAPIITSDLYQQYIMANRSILIALTDAFNSISQEDWNKDSIAKIIKGILSQLTLKMPQLAIPVRVALFGIPQTPSIDAMLFVLGREETLNRLNTVINYKIN